MTLAAGQSLRIHRSRRSRFNIPIQVPIPRRKPDRLLAQPAAGVGVVPAGAILGPGAVGDSRGRKRWMARSLRRGLGGLEPGSWIRARARDGLLTCQRARGLIITHQSAEGKKKPSRRRSRSPEWDGDRPRKRLEREGGAGTRGDSAGLSRARPPRTGSRMEERCVTPRTSHVSGPGCKRRVRRGERRG